MQTDPLKAAFFFLMSNIVLDEVDGKAARRFKQGLGTINFLMYVLHYT